jgi:hypothetical protein
MDSPLILSINEPQTARQSFTPASINEPPVLPGGDIDAPAPTLSQIQPAFATIGGADLTMQCIGDNFTPAAYITFNGGQEPTQWHSATKVTTIVKPSTATTAGVYPVTVVTPFGETETLTFEFRTADPDIETDVIDPTDPDDLEDEIEQAEEEGEFKALHVSKTVTVKKVKK